MDAPFQDNVTIITGASLGLGEELACQMAAQGAKLALAARSADRLEAVAKKCRALGGEAIAVPTDVSDEAACRALIAKTVEHYGRIDTLVNNAGISMWATFDALESLATIERIVQVNLLGSVYCTAAALPYLKESQGRLVAVSSLAGKAGVPTRTGYAASKHGLVGLFDSLRIELMGSGVTVTLMFPGFVATGLHERIAGPDGQPLGKDHPVDYSTAMTTEECARIMLRAMARRQRQVIMTPRGKIGQWLKLIAPGLVDRIARRAIESGR